MAIDRATDAAMSFKQVCVILRGRSRAGRLLGIQAKWLGVGNCTGEHGGASALHCEGKRERAQTERIQDTFNEQDWADVFRSILSYA